MIEMIEMIEVPCNGCTRCCKHWDMLRILPHENPDDWKTVPHPFKPGAFMLDHKPNGDCWYLGEHGCTIHNTKPQMCREMDCRNIAKMITYTQFRKAAKRNMIKVGVWKKGKELLNQQISRKKEIIKRGEGR